MKMRTAKLHYFLLFGFVFICDAYIQHGRPTSLMAKREFSPASCDFQDKYRTMDGSCNNMANPILGVAGTPYARLLPNAYADGVSAPRVVSSSPREVSVKVHREVDARDDVTLMVMQWGQFLAHDITLTPKGTEVGCCSEDKPEGCFNIPLVNDEFFTNRHCMPLRRSTATMVNGVLEQVNAITTFIDAGLVYGSSVEESNALRGENGRLKTEDGLLPTGPDDPCTLKEGERCFHAGESRLNEQPALAMMHTIFMREHNRIVEELETYGWTGESLFQEARKILGAIIQHITYKEYLPIVLAENYRKANSLDVGEPFEYDPDIDPTITNSFATAAFRFGHSQIPNTLLTPSGELQFKDLFNSPTTVLNQFEEISLSVYAQESMASDQFFAHSVTRHLFERAEEEKSGFDLAALNIQRGREHGLPAYNEFRTKFCNLSRVDSLQELFPSDPVAQTAYAHIDEVDLFTGGMAELPVYGSLLGETFSCIIADQFRRLKFGDRYWFEDRTGPGNFTRGQLRQIEKVTLSRVICYNTNITRITADVFRPVHLISNPPIKCAKIRRINLNRWQLNDAQSGNSTADGTANDT